MLRRLGAYSLMSAEKPSSILVQQGSLEYV